MLMFCGNVLHVGVDVGLGADLCLLFVLFDLTNHKVKKYG